MTDEEVLAEFRAAGALLEGHFILSSGRRSGNYLQCARVLMNPERAARLAIATVQKLPRELRSEVDMVVSPAMGGIIIGHEIGRALGKDALFLERPEGVFELRRGFSIPPGQKVLMVEDVVTTGLSSRQAIDPGASVPGYAISNWAVLQLPKVLSVNLGKASSSVSAFCVLYPFVRTGMTDTYADNPKVFGRWQPRMLETHEAAEAFLQLLARPPAETDQGMYELVVDPVGADDSDGIEISWKQVRLDVTEVPLAWSSEDALRA